MSCEVYRNKLVEAVARGESALGGELAAHLRLCAECGKFHQAQMDLFGAIDSGMRTMVNETVPASLLPGVRARVAEAGVPRRSWNFVWGFAAVGVAAAALVGVGLLRQGPEKVDRVAVRIPESTRGVREAASAPPEQSHVVAALPKRHKLEVKRVTVVDDDEARPEVLVLAEERAAFARFVSDLPKERDVALALTMRAAEGNAKEEEIALLRIDELDVKPLESTNQ